MATCPCCGNDLPASAAQNDLCSACAQAKDSPEDSSYTAPKPARGYPVTKILIALNAVIFAAISAAIELRPWGNDLFAAMADYGPYTLSGQWWRLLTSQFLHNEPAHLLGNVLFLWILGKRAEQLFGRWVFLLLYLVCGVVASIMSLAVHPEEGPYGASGGVFGLAGALISAYGLQGLKLSKQARWKLALLVLWTAWNIYPDTRDLRVNNAAHAGGLLAGLFLGAMLTTRFGTATRHRRWLFFGTALLLVLGCGTVWHYESYAVSLRYAVQHLRDAKPDEALRDLDVVLKKNPVSVTGELLRANAYAQKRDYAKAETAVRHVLSVDSDHEYAVYLLALIEVETGRCKEAQSVAGDYLQKHLRASERRRKIVSLLGEPCNEAMAVVEDTRDGRSGRGDEGANSK